MASLQAKEIQDFLAGLADNFDDIVRHDKKIWSSYGAEAFSDVMDHFMKETGPKKKWKSIQRIGKILQDTTKLKQGVRTTSDSGRFRRGIVLYDPIPYAKTHDEGLTVKHPGTSNGFGRGITIGPYKFKMPQREFMWLSDKGMENIAKVTLNYALMGKAKK